MNSFEELSRRRFLGRTLKLGAAGFAASCAATSCSSTMTGPTTESPWQIGCYTRPWADYDYRVALDAIAEAGFKYAGLMTTKSETRLVISISTTLEEAALVGQEIKKRGLGVLSVYGGGIPVASHLKRASRL